MNISGKITHIGEVQTGEGKNGTWTKFQAVITEQEGQYPQSLAFDVFNDKIAVVEGEECTIHYQVAAKEYNGKYFTNINAWKKEGGLTALEQTNKPAQGTTSAATKPTGGTLSVKAPTEAQYTALKAKIEGSDNAPGMEMIEKAKKAYALTSEQVAELENSLLPF